jgi:hypothetical protein
MACIGHVWGSTPAERERLFPCDRHLDGVSDALFRAVDVDAPPAAVFRWLCQLKAAPYSYDWIDNFGRQSPTTLTPGLDVLEVGQRMMTTFELVEFERDRHLTLLLKTSVGGRLFGGLAVSYVVVPRGASGSRLIVKLLVQYPAGPIGWALRGITPWADLVMMRKQLLTLKGLAEAPCRPPSS